MSLQFNLDPQAIILSSPVSEQQTKCSHHDSAELPRAEEKWFSIPEK